MILCPCCGKPINVPTIRQVASKAGLTAQQRTILQILHNAQGGILYRDELAAKLYATDPVGGPQSAAWVVSNQIMEIRHRLVGFPYQIEPGSGSGQAARGYRLVIKEMA